MSARHCMRAFLDRPVPRGVIEEVLRAAAHAPSTRNNQPWQVAVLTTEAKDELSARLCADFDRGLPPKPDYVNRPAEVDAVQQARAEEAGAGILRVKGIARDDAAARRAHHRENFMFYGAPIALIFHLSAGAVTGTFLEMGFFMQNVMLGLLSLGVGTCPQYSVAGYADTIRACLQLGPDRLIVAGMSAGYVDPAAPVNGFAPGRAALEDYTQWFGTWGD